jgi:hypothetical protein
MMDYDYQTKREEIYSLKYSIYSTKSMYYLLDFKKYVWPVNTNSGESNKNKVTKDLLVRPQPEK